MPGIDIIFIDKIYLYFYRIDIHVLIDRIVIDKLIGRKNINIVLHTGELDNGT